MFSWLCLRFYKFVGFPYFEIIQQQGQTVTEIYLGAFSYTDLSQGVISNAVEQTQSETEYQDTWWPSSVDYSCFCTMYKVNEETQNMKVFEKEINMLIFTLHAQHSHK